MNMTTFKPFLLLVSLLALALVSSSVPLLALSKIPCAYRLIIKTSTVLNSGTTSNVSITVGDMVGNRVVIPNVVDWNIVKQHPPRIFFQRGAVDKLHGIEDCYALTSHPCFISVTITGTGGSPNWLPDYVDVDAVPVGSQNFHIGEWLNSSNKYTVVKNLCSKQCNYRLTILTKAAMLPGTTSHVSITVGDGEGNRVVIPNVVDWNITKPEPGYVPFWNRKVDKFLGKENCYALAGRPCFIIVTITGTGDRPKWLPAYVDVDAGPVGSRTFDIGEPLTSYNNYTVVRNLCHLRPSWKTSFTQGSLAT